MPGQITNRESTSPIENKKGVENHRQAVIHHEAAANHHREAIKQHEAGNHEQAYKSYLIAYGHHAMAGDLAREDITSLSEQLIPGK